MIGARRIWPLVGAGVALVALAALAASWAPARRGAGGGDALFADADDPGLVAKGAGVYALECARCHGADLKGHPDWRVAAPDGGARPPPQDDSGHSFEHGDADLFAMVKYADFRHAPDSPPTTMPAFAGRLSDDQILAVLAFIKSRWPLGVRASQATLNPGLRGLPKDAGDWSFAANCKADP